MPGMSDARPAFSPPLFGFLVLSVVHLVAQLVDGEAVAAGTQMVLMPLLAWLLLVRGVAAPQRLVQWALAALFFSWLGDSLPRFATGDTAFLLMVGGFLLAQCCYVVGMWSWRSRSVLRQPARVAPYAVALVVLLVLLVPGAGVLAPAVVLYGLALTATGVLATGLGRLAGLGGALFMVSDSLIAIAAFRDWELPAHDALVMLTYLLAQLFLVVGVINARSVQTSTGRPAAKSRNQAA